MHKQTFEEVCAPYSAMVYRHCLHMLRDAHEAEDAAQESMLRAWRAFDRYRGSGAATWLFRIAHNTCLDVLKSARMRHETPVFEDWRETHGDPADPSATPEESYLRASEDDRLWQAVLTLPPEQQTLIMLYYGENMSYEDIARAAGLRMGTVKSRLNRAKETLKKRLEKMG